MQGWTEIETPHGPVRAWRAEPAGPSKGAVLVIQEIFGVNPHIRSVADRLADAGLVALAPALFDPVEHGVELGYDDAGIQRARGLVSALGTDRAMDILNAAAEKLQMEGLRVGAVGFCWGGSLAFLCATRLSLPSVGYYGARSMPFIDEQANAALMFHFGADDPSIPQADIQVHREKQPQARVFVYEGAGHAFNRDVDPKVYNEAAATLAWQRTIDFLEEQLR
ncbi:MAG: dienelactone hydrolase family protein [Lysobacter sp.]|nr:dienelactone hydrolase family protein [Lysobacter sp.]